METVEIFNEAKKYDWGYQNIPVRCGKSDLGTFLISKLNEYPKYYNTILYK